MLFKGDRPNSVRREKTTMCRVGKQVRNLETIIAIATTGLHMIYNKVIVVSKLWQDKSLFKIFLGISNLQAALKNNALPSSRFLFSCKSCFESCSLIMFCWPLSCMCW